MSVLFPLIIVLGVLLALLLAHVRSRRRRLPLPDLLPYVLVPGVVAGLIWLFLTNVDFGLFNNILHGVGVKPVDWLGANSALPMLAAVDIWRNAGYWASSLSPS